MSKTVMCSCTYSKESFEVLAKLIVDEMYSKIQAKAAHHLALHQSYAKKYNGNSKWHNGMVKKYKAMVNYITFTRKNQGYWRDVFNVLAQEFINGS